MDGWISSMGSIRPVEYDAVMKRREAPTQAAWMDLKQRVLSERSRTQKGTYYCICVKYPE